MKLYIVTFIIFVFSLAIQTSHAESEFHSHWFQESKKGVVQEVYSDVKIYFDGRISATSYYLNRRLIIACFRCYHSDTLWTMFIRQQNDFGISIWCLPAGPPRHGVPAFDYFSEKLKLLDSVLGRANSVGWNRLYY